MRFFTARRLVLTALLPALLVACVIPGCASEGEGDRCGDDLSNPATSSGSVNSDDCGSGLVCVTIGDMNRCCNSNPNIVHDTRCVRETGSTATGGASGSGGAASGGTGAANTGAAGAASTDAAGAANTGAAGANDSSSAAGAGGN